jgi:hypothetical protein
VQETSKCILNKLCCGMMDNKNEKKRKIYLGNNVNLGISEI